MAQEGFFSCSGCGRLFKRDGSEDDIAINHDCAEDDESEANPMQGILAVLCICFLLAVILAGVLYFVDRARECEEAGGTYKFIENRCVVSLTEIDLDI